MAMPSFPYPDTEYAHDFAEVPGDLLHLQDLDYWSFAEDNSHRNIAQSPLKPQLADQQSHVPILPKAEPDFLPEYLESLPTSWYSQDQASFVPMAANFQPTPSSNQQLQLQISEPPTPAAECQVTSTNLSPLPLNSPYSPHSDVSYDTGEGFESSLMDGSDIGLSLADLDEINLKGLTEEQLVSFTARDLNRICRDMPEDVIKQLKKRRRTLKNRGYAYNSRIRRVTQKNGLEVERDDLQKQLLQLTERCKALEQEAEEWKKKAQALESRNFL